MRKLLLGAGYTSRVLALDDIGKLLRKLGMIFLYDLAVLDEIDSDIGGDIAECAKIGKLLAIYLDYILTSHISAEGVLYESYGAIELIETQKIIDLHSVARRDMVYDNSVLYRIYVHFAASNKKSISAIRIYFPLSTCLKYAARGSLSTPTVISFTRGNGCIMQRSDFARVSLSGVRI